VTGKEARVLPRCEKEHGEDRREASVRALILAAGWATRLGALAARRPKHLLPIGDRSAIDFLVDSLERIPTVRGIDVITHDLFLEQFQTWLAGRNSCKPLRVWSDGTRSIETRLGAIGDIQRFLDLARPEQGLLVLGGDNVCDFDLVRLAERAVRHPVVAVYDVGSFDLVRRYASVQLDADGRVRRFVEKDPRPGTTLAAVAMYGFPKDVLPQIRVYLESGASPDNLGSFAEWLLRRRPVWGEVMSGRWIDIGSPDEYERARREFGAAESGPSRRGVSSTPRRA
jgi:glucose-1-phosphate thymidylyltransferase